MSDRHSDADLIRICLEGTTDDLTDPIVSQIGQRLGESELLKAAVAESPIAEEIRARLADSSKPAGNADALSKHSRSSRVKPMLLLLGVLVVGFSAVFYNLPEDHPVPVGDIVEVPAENTRDAEPRSLESATESGHASNANSLASTVEPALTPADEPQKPAIINTTPSPDVAQSSDPGMSDSEKSALAAAGQDKAEAHGPLHGCAVFVQHSR